MLIKLLPYSRVVSRRNLAMFTCYLRDLFIYLIEHSTPKKAACVILMKILLEL